MADAPTDAAIVLAALDSGEWVLQRHLPQSCFTDAGNKNHAWSVKRAEAPYSSEDGNHVWTGPTAIAALHKACTALDLALPAPTPSPPVAAPPATPVVTTEMVDAYLIAQRKTVEEVDRLWGHPTGKAPAHMHPVREACRAGLIAALAAQPQPQPAQSLTGAVDAARYQFLCAHPDWRFIEALCLQFSANNAAEFKAGMDRAIDAKRGAGITNWQAVTAPSTPTPPPGETP